MTMAKKIKKQLLKIAIISTITLLYITIVNSYAIENENTAGESTNSEIDITSNFKDENLKNAILELAKEATGEEEKTQIYESDIDKIVEMPGGTSLKLANMELKDLTGIEAFAGKGVTWIFLDWNELTDLSPLSSLTELTKISFSGNQVTDLLPLASLKNLNNITAINNNIATLEPLANLSNIQYICLDGNKLSSIQEISNWVNLRDMSFANNVIEQIPNLELLQSLETVNLSGNKIKSLVGLPNIESLTKLEIDNNGLTSLEGIENLSNLQILSCSNNQLSDITPITKIKTLENLNLNANLISDINGLESNTNLQYLYVDNNNILDFAVLEKLENLSKYTIYNQKIAVEIKEKITSNNVWIPLPELYTNLNDVNSFIYVEGLVTELEGDQEFEINDTKTQIKLKAEDLESGTIIVKASDEYNTILRYEITLDKQAPIIQGVEDNKAYIDPITVKSDDTDIETVVLTKDGQRVNYSLGQAISDVGKYVLEVSDFAGNKTTVNFEIKTEFNEGIEYEVKDGYILNITSNTTFEQFKTILNANVAFDVYRNNQKLTNNQIIKPGDLLVTEFENSYYLIVKGDGNKDGYADITDLLVLKRYLLQMLNFNDEYSRKAMDLNQDSEVDITDLLLMRRLLIQY